MRLLVVTREFPPYVQGGISYHLKYLYEELVDRGHDITILAGRANTVSPDETVSVDREFTVVWTPYLSPTAHHLQYPLSAWLSLRDIRVTEFDAVLTHTEIPFSLDVPVIAKYHDSKQAERPYMRERLSTVGRAVDAAMNPTRRWVDRRSLARADHLVFNSDLTRETWERNYPVRSPSDVIHNGVDLQKFSPQPGVEETDYLLFVGDAERKGLSEVRSFAPESPYPIYVAGDTDPGVENTKHLGRLSQRELTEYYSAAYATIHPSRFEAFGNVVLESLACGTPVIVSDRCGAAEIVDESCGAVTTDITRGIEQVRGVTAEACRRRAENYSWGDVASRTENLVRQVVRRSSTPSSRSGD